MDIYEINNKRCRMIQGGAVAIFQMVDEKCNDIYPYIKTECGKGFIVEGGLFAIDWLNLVKTTGKGIEQFKLSSN